jgi:hypothetical protein
MSITNGQPELWDTLHSGTEMNMGLAPDFSKGSIESTLQFVALAGAASVIVQAHSQRRLEHPRENKHAG